VAQLQGHVLVRPGMPTEIDWYEQQSQLIIDNHEQFVSDCYAIHDKFKSLYPNSDSTWTYDKYNVFALSSPMPLWWDLYNELSKKVRSYLDTQDPLWMQSWINFHKSNEVLDWHDHGWPYHGYVSINPCDTTTLFKGYKIKNSVGKIYIGPGNRQHKVRVDNDFDDIRITLGFDVTDNPQELPCENWSLMPLL